MNDDLRATPREETKYGSQLGDVDHVLPTDCVLCDYSGDTHEAFEEHMAEVHES